MAILVNMLQGTLVKSLNVYAPHLVRSPPYPSVPKSILPASAFTTASRPGGLHPLLTQEPAHQALPRLPHPPRARGGQPAHLLSSHVVQQDEEVHFITTGNAHPFLHFLQILWDSWLQRSSLPPASAKKLKLFLIFLYTVWLLSLQSVSHSSVRISFAFQQLIGVS